MCQLKMCTEYQDHTINADKGIRTCTQTLLFSSAPQMDSDFMKLSKSINMLPNTSEISRLPTLHTVAEKRRLYLSNVDLTMHCLGMHMKTCLKTEQALQTDSFEKKVVEYLGSLDYNVSHIIFI